jgi:hypothetical protein
MFLHTVYFDELMSKIHLKDTSTTPLFLLNFIVVLDHLKAGLLPRYCGLQSIQVSVSFQSRAKQTVGWRALSWVHTLVFLSGPMVPSRSGPISKIVAL